VYEGDDPHITLEAIETCSESEFATGVEKWRELAQNERNAEIKRAEDSAAAKAKEEAEAKAAEEAERKDREAAAEAEAKRQEEEQAELDRQAEAAQAKAAEEKAKATEAYSKWLSDNGYDEKTDTVGEENGNYVMYRRIATIAKSEIGFDEAL